MESASLNLANPVLKAFIGYAAIVLLKTVIMSLMTAYYRTTRLAFSNEEELDYFFKDKKNAKTNFNNPEVERVRRAHLNDLENVLPFVLLGLLYVLTGPSLSMALIHFRVFTASRLLHTVVYLLKIPQPARALCFFGGLVVNVSLAIQIIMQGAY